MEGDPLRHRAHADAILGRAADQLRELLRSLAGEIDPFPEFPGSFFSYGIEVDPPPGAGSKRGCVILAEDGELFELQVGLDIEQATSDDAAASRQELRLPLDDLSAGEYVAYAYRAVEAAVAHLEAAASQSAR